MLYVAFSTNTQNLKTLSNYHLSTAEKCFVCKTINCMQQMYLGREYSILPSVTHMLIVSQVCPRSVTVGRCVNNVSCLKVSGQYNLDILNRR